MGEFGGRRAYSGVHGISRYALSTSVRWTTSALGECVAPTGRLKRAREEEERQADSALCEGGSGAALKVRDGEDGRTTEQSSYSQGIRTESKIERRTEMGWSVVLRPMRR